MYRRLAICLKKVIKASVAFVSLRSAVTRGRLSIAVLSARATWPVCSPQLKTPYLYTSAATRSV